MSKSSPDAEAVEVDKGRSQLIGLADAFPASILNQIQAENITRSSLTRVVVCGGAIGSGKTTLLATIHDLFLKGEFAGYCFAGSRTLLGFESRCFESRIESGRNQADTERTKANLDEVDFLHLAVRKSKLTDPVQHLLFPDISGEVFRQARSSTAECQRLWILNRADHFVVLFDGAKLANLSERHGAKAFGTQLIRSCIDSNMIDGSTNLDIIFTKMDVVNKSPQKNDVISFIAGIKKFVADNFEKSVARVRFIEIAARPLNDHTLVDGYGLERAFPDWVEVPSDHSHSQEHKTIENYSRQFQKFRFTVD